MSLSQHRDGSPDGGSPPRLPPYLGTEQQGPAPPPVHRPPEPGPPAGPRPFVLTGGRVVDDLSGIGMETQVTASAGVPTGRHSAVTPLSAEHRLIVALCNQPISIAEISARLRLHLGVIKVLVSDLQAAGHVVVHVENAPNPRSPELILRVMHGLRTIS